MNSPETENIFQHATFGRRKVTPRVCIADSKQHIRTFLSEALEELGFIAGECRQVADLSRALDAQLPDLVVIGLSEGGMEAGEMLKTLAAEAFDGRVLLLGPRESPVVTAVQELGESLGIAMLPVLATPFGSETLHSRVAPLMPVHAPLSPPVDAVEALRAGWLELWYQPIIDARTLTLRAAEALIRIRHPTWGVVPPAFFIPDDGDPHFLGLSEFVIDRALDDWSYFVAERGPVEIAINLPIAFLQDPKAVETLGRRMPNHAAFEGLIVEVNGTEVIRNLDLVQDVARRLRFHNIVIAIDDLGAEWPALVGLSSFPFGEIKVAQKFIAGCADDRLKRVVCRQILDLANGYGARTVAEGVETRADFLAVREMGFDLVQGFLFAKPAPAKKFVRTLGRQVNMP